MTVDSGTNAISSLRLADAHGYNTEDQTKSIWPVVKTGLSGGSACF